MASNHHGVDFYTNRILKNPPTHPPTMNLRSATLFFACAVLLPINVQAQFFSNLFSNFVYNVDRFVEFFTFGLIDIKDNDVLEEIDEDLPGGLIFGGVCNRLKNIVINRFVEIPDDDGLPIDVQPIIDSVKCGCDIIRFGGEMKFGCNFQNPVCVNLSDIFVLDDAFFDDDDSINATDGSTNATDDGGRRRRRRLEDLSQDKDIGFCATANIRADYNGRSPLTPFGRETLTTSACAQIINATFNGEEVTDIPKLCAKVEHNDGLTNLVSLKTCQIFAVDSKGVVEECNKCEICGEEGLGVLFDCSNIELGGLNFTIPAFDTECLSAGAVPLSKMNDENFIYRPFLTPMP